MKVGPQRGCPGNYSELPKTETTRRCFGIQYRGQKEEPTENMRASKPMQTRGCDHDRREERGKEKIATHGKMQAATQPGARRDSNGKQSRDPTQSIYTMGQPHENIRSPFPREPRLTCLRK